MRSVFSNIQFKSSLGIEQENDIPTPKYLTIKTYFIYVPYIIYAMVSVYNSLNQAPAS